MLPYGGYGNDLDASEAFKVGLVQQKDTHIHTKIITSLYNKTIWCFIFYNLILIFILLVCLYISMIMHTGTCMLCERRLQNNFHHEL